MFCFFSTYGLQFADTIEIVDKLDAKSNKTYYFQFKTKHGQRKHRHVGFTSQAPRLQDSKKTIGKVDGSMGHIQKKIQHSLYLIAVVLLCHISLKEFLTDCIGDERTAVYFAHVTKKL